MRVNSELRSEKGDQPVRKPAGGFCLIRGEDLVTAWFAYRCGHLKLLDLRVWLACFELVARRCGAQEGCQVTYSIPEIGVLVDSPNRGIVREAIRRLEKTGFLEWSESDVRPKVGHSAFSATEIAELGSTLQFIKAAGRLVPFPRRVLRFLAKGAKRSVIAVALAHALRCLFFRNRVVTAQGWCKASWISEVFNVDLRNVKAARRLLVEAGWLAVEPQPQVRMNRWGQRVTVNLAWASPKRNITSPPPKPLSTAKLPPPIKTRNSLKRSYNQKPAGAAPNGVHASRFKNTSSKAFHVEPDDLVDAKGLTKLFDAAVKHGYVQRTQGDLLWFFAAAERAKSVGRCNPPGLFATLVRQKLRAYPAQAHEDVARKQIAELEERGWRMSTRHEGGHREVAQERVKRGGPELIEDRDAIRAIIARTLRDWEENPIRPLFEMTSKGIPRHSDWIDNV